MDMRVYDGVALRHRTGIGRTLLRRCGEWASDRTIERSHTPAHPRHPHQYAHVSARTHTQPTHHQTHTHGAPHITPRRCVRTRLCGNTGLGGVGWRVCVCEREVVVVLGVETKLVCEWHGPVMADALVDCRRPLLGHLT